MRPSPGSGDFGRAFWLALQALGAVNRNAVAEQGITAADW